jgi:hypothetical protein
VQHCIAAAEEAGRAFAYADAARYLAHAREALDLLSDGSPRLRLRLLFGQALYARVYASGDCERLTQELLQLARGQRDAVMLARAVLLLDLHPGFPALSGAGAGLEEPLRMLPDTELELRAALLARRATSAPYAFDAERSAEQVASALALIADTEAPYARYCALSALLYLRGGPSSRSEASLHMRELFELCAQKPDQYVLPPALLEMHRAIVAQQEGDLLAQEAALLRCERLTHDVGSRELLWHCQRFSALALINTGDVVRGAPALEALHDRAEQEALSGARLFRAYDRAIVLSRTPGHSLESLRDVLAPNALDVPSVWSLKVRVLAALGERRAARAALCLVPADQLAHLPCDRDYLGTLGALAHASVELRAHDYAAALYDLLEPYNSLFAAHIAFYCEGSVAQLRGLLAQSLDLSSEAAALLAFGVSSCERAGLLTCAELARRRLGLLRRG